MAVGLRPLFVFIVGITCVSLAFYLLVLPSIPGMSWTKQWNQLNHPDFSAVDKHHNVSADKWIVVTSISYPTPDIQFLAKVPGWKVVVVGDTKTSQNWSFSAVDKYHNVSADKWIVVTSISYPTPDIQFLAKVPGWKVVVVGDTKTSQNWSWPNCIYLGTHDQHGLRFETVNHLPVRSYARKTVGYLFAISHGAKVVYETDDDNRPLDLLKNFVLDKTMWGLSFKGARYLNPYRHFGQLTLWPRGYPMSAVGENFTSDYQFNHYKTPSIQQGVVNGDPDMDAIFRLTRKKTFSVLNVTFDGGAPPVIVTSGVFSPFNSQNTLFLYDALWALLIPATTSFRVCDIWRGYWAQRLLWEMGGNLGFFPPNAFQRRNSHSYLLDAVDEKDLYFHTERLLDFLKAWKCKKENTFFECMIQLSTDMVQGSFWEEGDGVLTESWVVDLKAIGYKEPQRIQFGSLKHGVQIIDRLILPNETMKATQASNVTFWAVEQTPQLTYDREEFPLMVPHLIKYAPYCNNVFGNLSLLSPNMSIKTFPNILLIVVFNFPFYSNIPFLEAMYKLHFPRIIYCGSNKKEFDKHAQHMKPVSFIELDIHNGWFGQKCLTQVMKMNYNVDGYLYVGDDVLLNVWNLHKLPWDKLWIYDGGVIRKSVKSTWGWFYKPDVGYKRYEAAIQASRSLNRDKFDKFVSTLANNTGHKDAVYYTSSDAVYVPRRFREDVIYFLEHFTKFNFFLEMAIPSVFGGIEVWSNVHKLAGTYLWGSERQHTHKYFNSSHIILHPFKISTELKTDGGRKFFCETFLPLTMQDGR